jgi:hypothetical protein
MFSNKPEMGEFSGKFSRFAKPGGIKFGFFQSYL